MRKRENERKKKKKTNKQWAWGGVGCAESKEKRLGDNHGQIKATLTGPFAFLSTKIPFFRFSLSKTINF